MSARILVLAFAVLFGVSALAAHAQNQTDQLAQNGGNHWKIARKAARMVQEKDQPQARTEEEPDHFKIVRKAVRMVQEKDQPQARTEEEPDHFKIVRKAVRMVQEKDQPQARTEEEEGQKGEGHNTGFGSITGLDPCNTTITAGSSPLAMAGTAVGVTAGEAGKFTFTLTLVIKNSGGTTVCSSSSSVVLTANSAVDLTTGCSISKIPADTYTSTATLLVGTTQLATKSCTFTAK